MTYNFHFSYYAPMPERRSSMPLEFIRSECEELGVSTSMIYVTCEETKYVYQDGRLFKKYTYTVWDAF